MTHYIHHVPGRLRIKSPHLKRNAQAAHQARQYMEQVDGVLASEVNPVTGSLLIHYDAQRVGAQTLLNSLRGLGYVPPEQGYLPVQQGPNLAQTLSDKVVNKLVETVIERSATALIAAII